MFIAENLRAFRALFGERLQAMLTSDSIGAFILVLANSMQDAELQQRLATPLQRAFTRLTENTPDAPPDDAEVFAALQKTALDDFSQWRSRRIGLWRLNLNPLRALRPARASGHAFGSLQQPFNKDGFHFNKPFLKPEILWQGKTQDMTLTVLYNKFPFAPFHLLIAPQPEHELPQFLTGEHHTAMWKLLQQHAEKLPGLRLAYNSIGAGASVNHLHFQGIVDTALAVESAHWQHRGGDDAYPLSCAFHQTPCDAWKQISEYQRDNQPFNMLYTPDGCYVVARAPLGELKLPDWGKGAAWAETCGLFTFQNERDFQRVSGREIERLLASLNS